MLESLHIQNLALIERAEISFGEGLNVLTGETGAGKSIVVDAISAVSGARVPRDLVRSGEDLLTVTAEFSIAGAGADAWFAQNDIEPEDTLIIRRAVTRDGKGSARVNGVPVTVAQLRELGAHLIDIHGQNDGRRLLDERAHLSALDAFGGYAALLADYGAAFSALRENIKAIEKLTGDAAERERRADYLRGAIAEIEETVLQPGESEKLEERRTLLLNASRLSGAFDGAYEAMYGGDDSDGAAALLRDAESFLESAAEYSERFRAMHERVRDMRYNAEDVADEVMRVRREMDFSPEELDAVEERMAALRRVTRKYGGGEDAALAWLEAAKTEMDELEFSDENRAKLEKAQEALRSKAEKLARELTEARTASAERLRARIEDELSQLAMPGVRFEVQFVAHGELTASGAEDARFLMSANPGEAPGAVARIASGGELSRIMLALKNVLAETDPVGVVVFDEVDAGVSGIAAQRVGEKLSSLARARQVLCVTHLPQIAAMADAHFAISKASDGDGNDVRTRTSVARLDRDGRVDEIARLIGGANITETTRKSADEMISRKNAGD